MTIDSSHLREAARQLYEGTSAILSDEEKARAIKAARQVAETARGYAKDDDSAILLTMSFARLVATLGMTPVIHISEDLGTLSGAYAMATGILAGLVPDERSRPVIDNSEPHATPSEDLDAAGAMFGQYL